MVAGINGFVGHHVANELAKRGVEVVGLGNQKVVSYELKNIVATYFSLDLTDPAKVSTLKLSGIDGIINLAGFANVGDSVGKGKLYNKVNVGVHSTLYQECLNQGVSPRIIAVSTGAVYDPNQALPITEDSNLIDDQNTNEYVISKKLMEKSVLEFNKKGLSCYIVRPFNHTGPGQKLGFLLPDLAEQVKESAKSGKPMLVGNLKTKRDFTDVRDVARAYVDLVMADSTSLKHAIYNICSGKSISGEKILENLLTAMGKKDIETRIDPAKLRKNEIMNIYGSFSRLQKDTGWHPTISIEQTIDDFVRSD